MRALRFGAVASAGEAMVAESVTDGNPPVDADESSRQRLDRTHSMTKSVPFRSPFDPRWRFEALFLVDSVLSLSIHQHCFFVTAELYKMLSASQTNPLLYQVMVRKDSDYQATGRGWDN